MPLCLKWTFPTHLKLKVNRKGNIQGKVGNHAVTLSVLAKQLYFGDLKLIQVTISEYLEKVTKQAEEENV